MEETDKWEKLAEEINENILKLAEKLGLKVDWDKKLIEPLLLHYTITNCHYGDDWEIEDSEFEIIENKRM
ncbi:MAG: hypothetical protein ACFFDX_16405 [Candidatus Odinarchaeota archaeon]